jgi:hypothetical protein
MSAVVPNFNASEVTSDGQRAALLIRSILAGVRTAIPVQVLAVHPGAGSPAAIGTVDVQPLVQMVDGNRTAWSLKPNYGVPFCRVQTGTTAIIADPQVNDIGIAVACDRDISKVLATGGQLSMPGSARKHNLSDLVYLFSIISSQATITQYLQMTASLLKAVFPEINLNGVTINSEGTLTAPIVSSGNGATGSGNNVTVVNGIVTSVS